MPFQKSEFKPRPVTPEAKDHKTRHKHLRSALLGYEKISSCEKWKPEVAAALTTKLEATIAKVEAQNPVLRGMLIKTESMKKPKAATVKRVTKLTAGGAGKRASVKRPKTRMVHSTAQTKAASAPVAMNSGHQVTIQPAPKPLERNLIVDFSRTPKGQHKNIVKSLLTQDNREYIKLVGITVNDVLEGLRDVTDNDISFKLENLKTIDLTELDYTGVKESEIQAIRNDIQDTTLMLPRWVTKKLKSHSEVGDFKLGEEYAKAGPKAADEEKCAGFENMDIDDGYPDVSGSGGEYYLNYTVSAKSELDLSICTSPSVEIETKLEQGDCIELKLKGGEFRDLLIAARECDTSKLKYLKTIDVTELKFNGVIQRDLQELKALLPEVKVEYPNFHTVAIPKRPAPQPTEVVVLSRKSHKHQVHDIKLALLKDNATKLSFQGSDFHSVLQAVTQIKSEKPNFRLQATKVVDISGMSHNGVTEHGLNEVCSLFSGAPSIQLSGNQNRALSAAKPQMFTFEGRQFDDARGKHVQPVFTGHAPRQTLRLAPVTTSKTKRLKGKEQKRKQQAIKHQDTKRLARSRHQANVHTARRGFLQQPERTGTMRMPGQVAANHFMPLSSMMMLPSHPHMTQPMRMSQWSQGRPVFAH